MNEPGTNSAAVNDAAVVSTRDEQVACAEPEPGTESEAGEERITLRMQVHLAKPSHGIVLRGGPRPKPRRRGRIPRVARMLALAHRFEALLERGVVPTQTELARLAKLTTARITQIMNLLVLAPDIQEELLFWPPVTRGRKTVTMR